MRDHRPSEEALALREQIERKRAGAERERRAERDAEKRTRGVHAGSNYGECAAPIADVLRAVLTRRGPR